MRLLMALIGVLSTAEVAAVESVFPDGPYAVGTTAWHLVDTSRHDPMSTATYRELMV